MASISMVAIKKRLVGTSGVIAGLAGLEDVSVSYDLPLANIPRELIHGGDVGGPVELSAMASGAGGRIRREARPTVDLVVRVYKTGLKTTEETDERAEAIVTIVCDYIAANPTLGGTVTGLKIARVDAVRYVEFIVDQDACSGAIISIGALSIIS